MSTRESMQWIYEREGVLTPRMVVDEWSNPSHPNHEFLEWDDLVAAALYRESQVKGLLRGIDK